MQAEAAEVESLDRPNVTDARPCGAFVGQYRGYQARKVSGLTRDDLGLLFEREFS